MTHVAFASRLKILVALQRNDEGAVLQHELECIGHRVQFCSEVDETLRLICHWRPDLVIVEESLGRDHPDAGLRLAEYCRATEDQMNGWPGTRVLVLIPVSDWDRFKRAQKTGAHVIVKGTNLDATIRYIQTIADDLTTDRVLGPGLVGLHKYRGGAPHPNCETCDWVGAEIAYCSSQTDLQHLTPVRVALLNILLCRRRGISPVSIETVCHDSAFLRRILKKHLFRSSAVKMEVTRLRRHFSEALETVGAPYTGVHFLPFVPHGSEVYYLAGNRRLIHVPATDPITYT